MFDMSQWRKEPQAGSEDIPIERYPLNAPEEYKHLPYPPRCSNCFNVLGKKSVSLFVSPQWIDGMRYWGREGHCCSNACANVWSFRLALIGVNMDDNDQANPPSQEYRQKWLYAWRCTQSYPQATYTGGKWLIFCSQDNVDEVWSRVRTALLQEYLGDVAKVSTAASCHSKREAAFVICVYSYEYA
ncbi:putative phosphothreonine lyase domain-containg protein [Ktedonobacter robiniae]|uniref:Uncharacterized protein n=1 Tax=Ktedonobacter robiniae TaxID=2778365 RepID=A0ABQ3V3R4_9CHLR|nr:hypothetical protein KSB_77600 [Ktedonobacter robiniae]